MKKPHEETWAAVLEDRAGYDCMTDAYVIRNERGWRVLSLDAKGRGPDPEASAVAQLVAQAPAMARVLLRFVELWPCIETCTPVDDELRVEIEAARRALKKAGVR